MVLLQLDSINASPLTGYLKITLLVNMVMRVHLHGADCVHLCVLTVRHAFSIADSAVEYTVVLHQIVFITGQEYHYLNLGAILQM